MTRFLISVVILICFNAAANAQIQKLIAGKYWQYSHTLFKEDKNHVYNFKRIPSTDSIKEVAMYFNANGTFKEVVNPQTHPKPPRTGTWSLRNDTVIINFPNQRWNYKILYIDNKEFQCTMSK